MRTLVELLRPGTADLARRWLAALLLVPPEERESIVEAVETQIVAEYDFPLEEGAGVAGDPGLVEGKPVEGREVVVRYPPVQHQGYVEEVVKTYGVVEDAPAASMIEEPQQKASKHGRKTG